MLIRRTESADFSDIVKLCGKVYPETIPWTPEQLASHLAMFPEGQFVAVDDQNRVVGMAASLIVFWDDYDFGTGWQDFTAAGSFTNHDPERGHTLYGAEVMVDPDLQGQGIGKALYTARRELAEQLGLWRIRAGARLRGYHRHRHLSPEAYVERVMAGAIFDRTLSFQLRQGFQVLGVVSGYLRQDFESQGFAAVIEWLNPQATMP